MRDFSFNRSKGVTNKLWLGLNRNCEISDPYDATAYKWLGDGSPPFSNNYWDTGEPNNGGNSECCAAMNGASEFKWIDQTCTTPTNYVWQCRACYRCKT